MQRKEVDLTVAARGLVKRSRAAQGLPPRITDPAVIDRVARLIYFWRDPPNLSSEVPGDRNAPGK